MEMPTTFKPVIIIIEEEGFAKKTIRIEVKRDVLPAQGLVISVVRSGTGESEVPITDNNQVVSTLV